jgi:hypothetical protein
VRLICALSSGNAIPVRFKSGEDGGSAGKAGPAFRRRSPGVLAVVAGKGHRAR